MRCPYCGTENKDSARFCKKCRKDLQAKMTTAEPLWQPSIKWYGKMLVIIYAGLVVLYIVASVILKPYIRKIPTEVTPWLGAPNQAAKN